jgi:hypothetical protein
MASELAPLAIRVNVVVPGFAGIIEWLTSDDAGYATAGYFTIDGGQTCL